MKKYLLLLFFAFYCMANLSAQSIDDLDKKNGFNQFQFGDHISQWDSYVKLTEFKFTDPNTKVYHYTGNCCQKLFWYDIAGIFLTFHKDELVVIEIVFEKGKSRQYCDERLVEIMKNLVALYGEPHSVETPETGSPTPCLMWMGQKVILIVTHTRNYDSSCVTDIEIYNMKYFEKQYNLTTDF